MTDPLAEPETGRARRSSCPIAVTLDVLGDKWSLLIVRDLFLGATRFKEFLASPEKVTTNILADRLKRLERCGVISRAPYQDHPVRYAYRLTEKGRALAPVLRAVVDWAGAWEPDTIALSDRRMSKLRPDKALKAQGGGHGRAGEREA